MKFAISILFLCVSVLFVQCNNNQKGLSVDDFNFKGALGTADAQIERVGENHFKIILSHAPKHSNWSNMLQFEITKHASGCTLRLDVVFPGGKAYSFNDYFYSWSYDQENWQPVKWQSGKKDSIVKDSLVFPKFKEDRVYFGHQVPMSYQKLEELIEIWRKHPAVTVHVIGQSLGEKNIYRLEIADNDTKQADPRWVHYFTNQHPGEHNAQWRMVGMIDWLLSEEGKAYRKTSVSHFILMMSPDSPSNGWYRVNAQGVDMNRSYREEGSDSQEQAHEAYLCQKDLEMLMASPNPVTDIWSMHTWPGIVEPIMQPGPEIGTKVEGWETFREILIKNDKMKLIKPLKIKEKTADNSWTNGPHSQFGITSVLCEGGGSLFTKEENIGSGIVLIKSLAEYYH